MFGLLNPVGFDRPLRGGHAWSTVVCSTCASLGAEHGGLARLTAGPDTALLAGLYEAQSTLPTTTNVQHCLLRADAARLWPRDHPGARFAAAVSMLAAAAYLEDHLLDHDATPLPRAIAGRLARRWALLGGRATHRLGFDATPLLRQVATQREREAQTGMPLDHYVEPTAFCFGEVFAHTAKLSRRPENVVPLREAGAAFGAQVYLLDAVNDYAEDWRRKRFNPLHAPGKTPSVACAAARDRIERAQKVLEDSLARATLPQPEWIVPVLVDSLRAITQNRLRCGPSCNAAASPPPEGEPPPSAGAQQSGVKPRPPNRRGILTSCCLASGAGCGLATGGCCGFCWAEWNKPRPPNNCNTSGIRCIECPR